jgi:multicomponent Na+:H+ antiporter subunit C
MNFPGTPLGFVFAVTVGFLFASGVFLLLRKNRVKLVVGFGLLGHAVNLLVFSSGGLTPMKAPLIAAGEETLRAGTADPLPQALVLTAIVIGFGAQMFLLVLLRGAFRVSVDDRDESGGNE